MNIRHDFGPLSIGALLLTGACGGEETLELASTYLKSELISAMSGGGFAVTEADAVAFAGVAIDVPAGALEKDTTVTVRPSEDLPSAEGVSWVGPALEFGPAGLVFSMPATLTLRVNEAIDEEEVPTVRMANADNVAEWLSSDSIVVNPDGTWSAPVKHLTRFQPGRMGGPNSNAGPPPPQAQVTGGTTNIFFDLEALKTANLDVSGFSDEVIAPGNLGPNSVAFPINPNTGAMPPTTFVYETTSFAPVSGTIEHEGLIYFDQQFSSGNFSIGFDASRAVGVNSGFFVESTVEGFLLIGGVFFDVANPTVVGATSSSLVIEADLVVAPELADFRGNPGLVGADVGDVRISATAQPTP